MRKYEILYDWVLTEIPRWADSAIAEHFASQLAEPALGTFVNIAEQLRSLGLEIATANAARMHFRRWGELRQLIDRLQSQFPHFPDGNFVKSVLFSVFAEKLDDAFALLDEEDVDETAFVIRELSSPLPVAWFARENAKDPLNSIAVFSCNEPAALETAVASANISPSLVFHLLAALRGVETLPAQMALVRNVAEGIDPPAVEAYLRIAMLATGKPVHSPRTYTAVPNVLDQDSIVVGPPFQQWADVISVLSEYNSRDEVLVKYLTIYHVIENFMFKRPIVELERQHNGRMFSIRDFRRLYEQVEMGEGEALRRLFEDIFRLEATAGVSFKQHICSRWARLLMSFREGDLDAALTTLGVGFTFAQFRANATPPNFAKLVYSFRNAIVHNKETEFHLTYASLNLGLSCLLEAFLIPSLEEISFAVIGKTNPKLWYQNRELHLYR